MRQTGKFWLLAGFILFSSACSQSSLPRSTNDIQTMVTGGSTEAKSDRPTETGEGLPGYLIDPAKLAIESKDNIWTVRGSAGAVRDPEGRPASVGILLVRAPKKTVRIRRQDQDWQIDGSRVAAVRADATGAFQIQGPTSIDDLIFVKVEDAAGDQIQYKAGAANNGTVWIEGGTARTLDASRASEIANQVETAQFPPSSEELARLVEQVKTTRQCRNCNLAGADFSNADISGCDLSYSNLTGARFVLGNLVSCNFTSSNLTKVDFTQANMANSNLTLTDITGAIFSGANTEGVVGVKIPEL
ncbi:pentapeptide repeat-containing protein [Oligoflexus tunisiensis]|uniref:pentapeptide repeat-containing protein n=1 Tax=Oligoflexus tunisiensis TaxID=708132 RepID=UPI000AB9117D|nr:pentapeptide repeat-containing protein [Oligoflexus tunisiensis]